MAQAQTMRLKNRIVCIFCLIISSGHSTPGVHNNIEIYHIGDLIFQRYKLEFVKETFLMTMNKGVSVRINRINLNREKSEK